MHETRQRAQRIPGAREYAVQSRARYAHENGAACYAFMERKVSSICFPPGVMIDSGWN